MKKMALNVKTYQPANLMASDKCEDVEAPVCKYTSKKGGCPR